MQTSTSNSMFSLTSRRKNLFVRICLGINVCVLLYLGVQFLDNNNVSKQNSAENLPVSAFLSGRSEGKKRTLSSFLDQSSNTNNQTLMPSTTLLSQGHLLSEMMICYQYFDKFKYQKGIDLEYSADIAKFNTCCKIFHRCRHCHSI